MASLLWALLLLSSVSFSFGTSTPIVVMHGIAASTAETTHIVDLLKEQLKGVYVLNVEIGNGKKDSILWPMTKQADTMCTILSQDPNLKNGFHVFAISQGGLIARGAIERCHSNLTVKNVVLWLSPQAGMFGVPNFEPWCKDILHNSTLCHILDHFVDTFIYTREAQESLSFPSYWVDPFRMDTYVKHSQFLADIDNLRTPRNEEYRRNMMKLESLVLVHSTTDLTLVPRETSRWEMFAPGSHTVLRPLRETTMYKEDTIGLRTLDESGRLRFLNTALPHTDQSSPAFDAYMITHILPYLT